MTPFILRGCTKLPAEPEPRDDHIFDKSLQLWINKKSGLPVVIEMQSKQSEFGETLITATAEGADQSEVSGFEASQFGETKITRREGEGADPIDFGGLSSSIFGEDTRKTVAPEPADPQGSFDGWVSQFGEATLTKTQEGADQLELSSDFADNQILQKAL